MGRKYVMQEDEDLFEDRRYFNEYIDDIGCPKFREVEDVDLDNLREFLIEVLHAFQKKRVSLNGMLDIIDYLETYLHRRYMDEWPENLYPASPDTDPFSIGLNALDFIHDGVHYGSLVPHVVESLFTYLKTPLGEEEQATLNMENFMEELKVKRLETANLHPSGTYTWRFDEFEEQKDMKSSKE